jgi:hypothetical protein
MRIFLFLFLLWRVKIFITLQSCHQSCTSTSTRKILKTSLKNGAQHINDLSGKNLPVFVKTCSTKASTIFYDKCTYIGFNYCISPADVINKLILLGISRGLICSRSPNFAKNTNTERRRWLAKEVLVVQVYPASKQSTM